MHLYNQNLAYVMPRIKYIVALIIILFQNNNFCKANSNPDLPEIPPRPSISELSKMLNNGDEYLLDKKVEIKGLSSDYNEGQKKSKFKIGFKSKDFDGYLKENHDTFCEKSFKLSSVELFSLALKAIQSLNLSLKSFDTLNGQIVAKDKFRNIVIMQILNQDKYQSKVKIFGHSSVIGRLTLKKTTTNLLALLSEKNKI